MKEAAKVLLSEVKIFLLISQLETCRAELKAAKSTISSQESTLQQLAKTSEAACKEYEDLQKQFEIEYAGRTQVEKMAHNVRTGYVCVIIYLCLSFVFIIYSTIVALRSSKF